MDDYLSGEYESPVKLIASQVETKIENDVMSVIQNYDIQVDKNELIKALNYDRQQYHKGYQAGYCEAQKQLWNTHEVACLLAEIHGGDTCACNYNGNDEWLPKVCDFTETCCPNPVGVACWEQFLKNYGDKKGGDDNG